MNKIINSRKKLSKAEKLDLLLKMRCAILKKMKVIKNGGKIVDFSYKTHEEWKKEACDITASEDPSFKKACEKDEDTNKNSNIVSIKKDTLMEDEDSFKSYQASIK